jgi:hypothetical protein
MRGCCWLLYLILHVQYSSFAVSEAGYCLTLASFKTPPIEPSAWWLCLSQIGRCLMAVRTQLHQSSSSITGFHQTHQQIKWNKPPRPACARLTPPSESGP